MRIDNTLRTDGMLSETNTNGRIIAEEKLKETRSDSKESAEKTLGDDMEAGGKKSTENKDVIAVSKDGDTLEISSKKDGGLVNKIPDAVLAKYSKNKLQALLKNNKISKVQYNKAVIGK